MPANPYGQKLGAYTANQRTHETTVETEVQALLSCANKLEAVVAPACDRARFGEAVRHNQRLWTVLQLCVTQPDNPLPLEVRRNLFQLSRYVDKASFQLMRKREEETLKTLININRQIAAGLGARREGAQPLPANQQPAPAVSVSGGGRPDPYSISTRA